MQRNRALQGFFEDLARFYDVEKFPARARCAT
jgi:NifU-like protein involved in Fe-S cluster formation